MDRLDSYAAFAAVAERASFAAAARHLKRTPASVTRAVAALEAALGVRLLNRNTRAVSLTEAGERHLQVIRRILADCTELRDLERADPAGLTGVVRITAPAHFGRLHLVPLLGRFMHDHPALRLDLLLVDRVVSLVEEGIDVGVRLGALPDSSLRAVRAGTLRIGVYASPAYLEAHGAPENWQEVTGRDVISCLAISPIPDRWRVEAGGATTRLAVRARFVVNTTDAAAEAAVAGLGLVRLISYQADPLVTSGALVRVPLPDTRITPIHIVQPAGAFTSAKSRLLVSTIAERLRHRFPD